METSAQMIRRLAFARLARTGPVCVELGKRHKAATGQNAFYMNNDKPCEDIYDMKQEGLTIDEAINAYLVKNPDLFTKGW